jgi:hypothetical protein
MGKGAEDSVATDLQLGFNMAVAVGSGSAMAGMHEEHRLAALPDQLRRIGDLLSAADGSSTPLYKAIFALLVCEPVYVMFGAGMDPLFVNGFAAMADGNAIAAVQTLGVGLGALLSGPIALHTLRLATRRGGLLAQLGIGVTLVPHAIIDTLGWWAKWGRRVAPVVCVEIVVLEIIGVFTFPVPAVAWSLAMVYDMALFSTLFAWWYSLKVAAALVDAPVSDASRKARAEVTRLRETGEKIDPEWWQTEVEEPLRQLGRDVMPVLSDGWGLSIGLVGAGLVVMTLSFLVFCAANGVFRMPVVNVVMCAILAFCAAAPFLLAIDPASVSTKCAKLEDEINAICGQDSSFVPAENFIKFVKRQNKDQGLGCVHLLLSTASLLPDLTLRCVPRSSCHSTRVAFSCVPCRFKVLGYVVTRGTLLKLASSIYSVVAAVGPLFLKEAGFESSGSCAAGSQQHASCEFGWMYSDHTCFKLFGYGGLGEPLDWVDAEEACLQHGMHTHLASVTSDEQQRAVNSLWSLVGGAGVVSAWIGLSDATEEGNFVWSDDEPLEYDSFDPTDDSQVGSDGGDGVIVYLSTGFWYDHDETDKYPYLCAKKASPVVASGGVMRGCDGGHWVMGTPYTQVGSLSYLPPTIVYGIYSAKVYEEIKPIKIELNETATTPAECATLVHRDHREATAAEYSNVGGEWCKAVFDA